jgi:hypothetical protein
MMRNVYLILLAIFLLILMFVWSNPAKAHENEIWKDANKYLMSGTGGQVNCGMGYKLAHQANGRWQPYLYAGHWHVTEWMVVSSNCESFMRILQTEETEETEETTHWSTGNPAEDHHGSIK